MATLAFAIALYALGSIVIGAGMASRGDCVITRGDEVVRDPFKRIAVASFLVFLLPGIAAVDAWKKFRGSN